MRLRPDVHEFTVEGHSDIHINVTEDVVEIVLHLAGNTVTQGSVKASKSNLNIVSIKKHHA